MVWVLRKPSGHTGYKWPYRNRLRARRGKFAAPTYCRPGTKRSQSRSPTVARSKCTTLPRRHRLQPQTRDLSLQRLCQTLRYANTWSYHRTATSQITTDASTSLQFLSGRPLLEPSSEYLRATRTSCSRPRARAAIQRARRPVSASGCTGEPSKGFVYII